MSAHRDTLTTTRQLSTPMIGAPTTCNCSCECGGTGESSCCRLDCLEQPRFFCGQALNDTDLNAMVRWTKDKTRLARFRDGWGVACGLEVRCDPKSPAGIIVGPGYGLSCCGDDIVVCEDISLDLADLCKGDDPCADPPQASSDPRRERAPATKDRLPSRDSTERVFDIYIRYKEVLSHPQVALGHRDCGTSGSDCEYSRALESSELVAVAAASGSDPVSERAGRWSDGYDACLSVVDEFMAHFGRDEQRHEDGEAVRKWLIRWMDAHHPHQFCFLYNEVCDASVADLSGSKLIRILFLLAQDCRNAYLSPACPPCTTPSGVPLARVWLDIRSNDGRELCTVACIDGYPPHRRNLADERWPAPLGQVNLGSVIWHRETEAQALTLELGISAGQQVPFALPNNVADLRKQLRRIGNLIVEPDRTVHPVIFEQSGESGVDRALCGDGGRVIGFEAEHLSEDDPRPVNRPQRAAEAAVVPGEPVSTPPEPLPETPDRPVTEVIHIGQRRAALLRENGIETTHQLRELSVSELRELLHFTPDAVLEQILADAR